MSSSNPSYPASASRRALPHTVIALAVVLVLALCARGLGRAALAERATWPRGAEYAALLPSTQAAPVIFAGFRELAADVFWARTLVYYGSSMVGDADYRYLERFVDTVIALDRKLERVYKWASLAVTFRHKTATQEEYRLAVKYLEQGMVEFPDKHELFLMAGQRYFLDLVSEDPAEQRRFRERGVALIEQAMRKKDAPKTLATFAATLRTKLGQKERALQDLREMILTTESEAAQKRLMKRYAQLAGEAFPAEARRAKEDFERGWRREVPFESPSMYVLLGDRPPAFIDFDRLATDRDLFGAELEAEPENDEADAPDDAQDGSAQAPAPPEAGHLD